MWIIILGGCNVCFGVVLLIVIMLCFLFIPSEVIILDLLRRKLCRFGLDRLS